MTVEVSPNVTYVQVDGSQPNVVEVSSNQIGTTEVVTLGPQGAQGDPGVAFKLIAGEPISLDPYPDEIIPYEVKQAYGSIEFEDGD